MLIYCLFLLSISLRISPVASEKFIELDHVFDENTQVWPTPGSKKFKLTPVYKGYNEKGFWYSSFNIEMGEHSGTHLDAPYHFNERGWTVDQIPVNHLFAPAAVIDIRKKVERDAMAELTADDVVSWVDEFGHFPNNSVILVLTGWDKRYNDSLAYFGSRSNDRALVFPGINVSAAQALLGYRVVSDIHIVGVGIDTPSTDVGSSQNFETHRELAAANVYGLENLKNLDKLPRTGSQLIVMPLKIRGGSGGPCRVTAQLQDSGSNISSLSVTLTVFSLLLQLRVT